MTPTKDWFQRVTVHWSPSPRIDLAEHVREGRLQVVQAGNFGPMLYGLADDESVTRWFPGQPSYGLETCLDEARTRIADVQAAGARYIGQMSVSWHYGDHETRKGLWEAWPRMWTPDLLGDAPCDDPVAACQIDEGGMVRSWPIEGRPYRTYSGCLNNMLWRAILRPMIRKAIDLGVDGLNVHHNFESPCRCEHCRAFLWPRLVEAFDTDERVALFGSDTLEEAGDLSTAQDTSTRDQRARFGSLLERATNELRKEGFDDLFVHYARSLKPDLLLGQWYHKYDFGPHDERSRLPSTSWAKDEDFIWYSQGAQKGVSYVEHGYIADMGMPARFLHAAAAGRPFIINKYDWKRYRLSIAEMAAHGGASLAVHWAEHYDAAADLDLDAYKKPVYRYQRFVADHEPLIRGAHPWGELAIVYPRRGEVAGDATCTDALRQIGRWLEDDHWLFDMILDEQILERARDYDTLVLAGVERLSPKEMAHLRWWLEECDGRLVLAGRNGTMDEGGHPRAESAFGAGEGVGASPSTQIHDGGRVLSLHKDDWGTQPVETPGGQIQVHPTTATDPFAQQFLNDLETLVETRRLRTQAPWTVRVRAWCPAMAEERVVLHWVNYHQEEGVDGESPVLTGSIYVKLLLPPGRLCEEIRWLDPEVDGMTQIDFRQDGPHLEFEVPPVLVYAICVVHLQGD